MHSAFQMWELRHWKNTSSARAQTLLVEAVPLPSPSCSLYAGEEVVGRLVGGENVRTCSGSQEMAL